MTYGSESKTTQKQVVEMPPQEGEVTYA